MKTYSPRPEHIERRWYVVDASGQVLGRLASEVAAILRGKHKPIFAPHMDTGDNVIVVNAEKVELTGGKDMKKVAYRHSGYPGGITATRYDTLRAERPTFIIEKAVRGMLPKNRLGRAMIRKLHVVAGPEHPHRAQQPVAYTLGHPPAWEGLPRPKAATAVAIEAPAPSRPATARPAPKPGTPAKRRTAAKATAAPSARPEGPTARKPAPKKPAARKPAARKPTASVAKSTASVAKSTARKSVARRPAAKKTPAPGKGEDP